MDEDKMTKVQELNSYDSSSWKQEFLNNKFYQDIASSYNSVIFSHKEMSYLKAMLHHTVYETPRKFLKDYNILDAVPYYYINFLLKIQPNCIADLGCGVNYFKPHLSGLVGIDADPNQLCADIFDHFDCDYVAGHQKTFDAVISINTIHFAPITEITQRLKWVSEIIKPGGRGFVSFNIETWLMYTHSTQLRELFGTQPNFDHVIDFVNSQLINTGLEFLVVDWPILHCSEHSPIRDELNGNIRLVFNV